MTMPFLPNEADATYADQAEPDSVDFEILLAGIKLSGVVSGCEVTESGTPAQTIDVAAGVVRVAGRQVTVAADADVAVTAADATNPRIDLITSNLSGVIVVTAGTAAANPVLPAIPETSVPLATLYVPANDNTHGDAQINDKRVFVKAATWFNIVDYGATGDGTTDDTTAIQAAIDAAVAAGGGTIYSPIASGTRYKVTTVDITTGSVLDIHVRGEGWLSKWYSSTASTLTLGASGNVNRLSMTDFSLFAAATGYGALEIVGNISTSTFINCQFGTFGSANGIRAYGSVWGMYGCTFIGCEYSADGASSTTPIVYLVDTGGGAICNANTFFGGTFVGSVGATAPEFFIESQGANYLYDNTIQGVNFEVSVYGAIHANGAKFMAIRDCGFYDATMSDDVIKLGKHTTGLAGQDNIIDNSNRIGGTIGAFYDINLDDTYGTTIINSGAHSDSSGRIDLNGRTCVVINPKAATIDGRNSQTKIIDHVSGNVTEYAIATTLDGDDTVVNIDTSGGAVAVTLPDNATWFGKNYMIRRDGASDVTVTRAGTDTFDDAATVKTLGSDGAAIGIFSIGDGEWKIVGTQGTVT